MAQCIGDTMHSDKSLKLSFKLLTLEAGGAEGPRWLFELIIESLHVLYDLSHQHSTHCDT